MLFSNNMKNFVNSKKILNKEEFKKKIDEGLRYEVSKNKLKHDIGQINYLLRKKLILKKYKVIIKNYKIVLNALPKKADDTDIYTLSKEFTYKLGPTFNNLIYYQPPDILEKKAINDDANIIAKSNKKNLSILFLIIF